MMKYCDVCRQSYGEEHTTCPHCAGAESDGAVKAVNGFHQEGHSVPSEHEAATVSDPEIDLGSPVTSAQPAPLGPPSGASFNSWADITPGQEPPAPGEKPRPRLIPLRNPNSDTPNEALIDLDQTPGPSSDPPSGASIASWATRVPPSDSTPAKPAGVECGSVLTARGLMEAPEPAETPTPTAPPPTLDGRLGLASLLLGVALGMAFSLLLWLVGIEPPQAWRRQVQNWLGRTPPTTSPTPAPTGTPE